MHYQLACFRSVKQLLPPTITQFKSTVRVPALYFTLVSSFPLAALFCNFLQRRSSQRTVSHRSSRWGEPSYFAAGSTLLLHYISSSGSTVAFCPRLVCWQEVPVWGWYLPRNVTCSQSELEQAEIWRFTERRNMCWKRRLLQWKLTMAVTAIWRSLLREKSQQVSFRLSDGWTSETAANRSPGQDGPNYSCSFLTTGWQNI